MALHGVNLGGWLVLERWMTPQLFAGTMARNEFELAKTPLGKQRIAEHHHTFITEDDIAWLAGHGIELLRVPVGHWIFGDAPPYVGALDRLDWLVKAARTYKLQILLDLHGAPGAQNAADHSGSGNLSRRSPWLKNRSAQTKTIAVLERLAMRYADQPHIWGIELLNEPSPGWYGLRLAWFYRRAYRAITGIARPGTRIIFSDAYRPWLLTGALRRTKNYPVLMDMHLYQCFGAQNKARSFANHLRRARVWRQLIWLFSRSQPVIIGEWSATLPNKTSAEETKLFIATQLQSFDNAEAHCFWSYKVPNGGRWSLRRMIETGTYPIK